MHKKLESELISLAHSILQMKNKDDVSALLEKASEIHEKLSVLAFVENYVNLVLTGHIHAYLRTKPVRFGQVHPHGPRHITVGAGGRKCEAPFRNATAEDFVQVRDATKYGYGMLHIFNKTTAAWDWIHTGEADERDYNELWQSEEQLPPGPSTDRAFFENQYFL